MVLHPLVGQHLNQIRKVAAEYGVERLEVFGSAMTSRFDPGSSDVDFLVYYPDEYIFGPFGKRLQDLESRLQEILGRQSQLIMADAISNARFGNSGDDVRMVVYESPEVGANT